MSEGAPGDRKRGPERDDQQKAAAATVGAATGAAVGAALGGPPGAIVGAATGTVRGVLAKDALDKVEQRRREPRCQRKAHEDSPADVVADGAIDAGNQVKREIS